MFFQKKVDRLIDVEKAEQELEEREPVELEGKDRLAMILAAILSSCPRCCW